MESLAEANNLATQALETVYSASHAKLHAFMQQHKIPFEPAGNGTVRFHDYPPQLRLPLQSVLEPCEHADTAKKIVQRSLVAALISEYETFLARILKLVLLERPEVCAGLQKTVETAHVFGCDTIQNLRSLVVDEVIDRFLYRGCEDQLKWLTDTFHVELKSNIDFFPQFVEISERRNLYTHSDGVITEKYLSKCAAVGVLTGSDLHVGDELLVGRGYYKDAWQTLLVVGLETGVSLWRHLLPVEIEEASAIANGEMLLEPIIKEQYALAQRLGEFLIRTERSGLSPKVRDTIRINTAQAYKWAGNGTDCARVLGNIDQASASPVAKLGLCVLNDRFPEATALVEEIGDCEDMKPEYYRDWPLFKELRKRPQFRTSFARVFGKPWDEYWAMSNPSADNGDSLSGPSPGD
jgi:hypothetical protein